VQVLEEGECTPVVLLYINECHFLWCEGAAGISDTGTPGTVQHGDTHFIDVIVQ
jgi:hypothetical protein